MVNCFAPGCNHHSENHTCKFYGFPNKEKKKEEYRRWIRLLKLDSHVSYVLLILPMARFVMALTRFSNVLSNKLMTVCILLFFQFKRKDRANSSTHSRVCSCHFRHGQKSAGPEMHAWNEKKLFPLDGRPPKKKKKKNKYFLQLFATKTFSGDQRNEPKPTRELERSSLVLMLCAPVPVYLHPAAQLF